jgi:CheY-like chemotaxis protein
MDLLSLLDFEMLEAENGQEGVAVAQAHRPDLVLMDNVMPVMNGLEATRCLRAIPSFKNVPIIAASASASESDKAQSLAAGVDTFISKPIDLDKLVQQIGALLHLSWIYEVDEEEVVPKIEGSDLVIPPPEEMQILHGLAMAGNMRDVRKRALHLETLDERYRPFAGKLRQLAEGFQTEAIVELVERHLES